MNHKDSKSQRFKKLFLLLVVSASTCFAQPQQKNVLLISIDTLRADHLGCYGYQKKTPNIDALAAKSVLFESAISQVPMTLPSHCTIFSGLYPYQHGVRNNENFVLPDKVDTIAELFKKNGYATGAVVGSFSLDSTFGVNQGFDFYDDKIGEGHDPEINRNAERRGETVWKISKEWLGKQKSPWFFFLHFFDPHAAYNPPESFPQTYDGEIAYTDRLIGEVIKFLQTKKWASTTIIILLSDHGESLGEHGESDHGVFLYDATLRVPLMISAPELKPARILNQVRLVDIAPTILDLIGVKGSFSGQTLLPLIHGGNHQLSAYSESYYANLLMGWAPLHSIRTLGKKWIDAPRPELYDLANDPREMVNIYNAAILAKNFVAELSKHTAKRTSESTQQTEIDPEAQEKLASLGYVTGGSTKEIASSFDPKDGITIWEQIKYGVALAQRGKFDAAEEKLKQVLQKQPDNVIAHKFLAAALHKQGKDEEAISHLQAALKSSLHTNDTKLGLTEIYLQQKKYPEAAKLLDVVMNEEPKNIRALRFSAALAMGTKKDQEALATLDQLLKIDPTDVNALSQRARLLSYMQRDQEALKAYESVAVHRALTDGEAIQVAAIYLTSRNMEMAEKYFRIALKANQKSDEAWKGLGLILAAQQKWPAAFEAFVNAGDCANASKMMQKDPSIPPNEIQVFHQKCDE